MKPQTKRFQILVTALVVAALTTGCSSDSSLATGDKGYIEGQGVVDQVDPADRVDLPVIAGGTLDGGQFDSRDHLGRVLVINVWGSWCPPCRAEAPALRQAWEANQQKGVQFVGIDVRDNDAAARAFERSYKITYPSISSEESGPAILALGAIIPRNAVPSTVVVDQDGRVAARVIGRTTYLTLEELIEATLAEPGAGQASASRP